MWSDDIVFVDDVSRFLARSAVVCLEGHHSPCRGAVGGCTFRSTSPQLDLRHLSVFYYVFHEWIVKTRPLNSIQLLSSPRGNDGWYAALHGSIQVNAGHKMRTLTHHRLPTSEKTLCFYLNATSIDNLCLNLAGETLNHREASAQILLSRSRYFRANLLIWGFRLKPLPPT